MSSTYSSYKIELIGTGEQAGTWGTTTNTNFSTAIEQAIGGYVSVTFTGLTKTLTLTDTNAAQDARALYLNLTGTPGGAATLELPAIQKTYIIKNSTTGGNLVTAKVTGMTGVVIPNGSTMTVYNNGTDVVTAHNNFNDGLTLGTTVLSANSASDALRITQLGSGNALVVEDEANPDSSRFQIDSTGRVSIGATTPGASNLIIARPITGATTAIGISQTSEIQSDVTAAVFLNRASPATQAAAFTLPNLYVYSARGATIGAGSSITNQYGYLVESNLNTATNNYGMQFLVPSGANNWNFYAGGTAPNYTAGALGIGSTSLTGFNLRVSRSLTGATSSISVQSSVTALSDVTASAYGFQSFVNTEAAAFTLPNLFHYVASGGTAGAGSTISNQSGFTAGAGLSSATSNYGFYSSLAAAANNWNFYAQGTANNYMAGALGIGSTTLTNNKLRIGGTVSAPATNFNSVILNVTYDSSVTGDAISFISTPTTQAAAFTVSNMYHFVASAPTIGAGSSVNNQYGFAATSGMTGATNNYGFYSATPSGANNWNFYALGTAPNYMAGALGLGTTTVTNNKLRVGGLVSSTGTNFNAISANITFDSTVTGTAVAFVSQPSTQAASFTISSLYHYLAQAVSLGAGSSITNQYGIQFNDFSAGATNNYAISSTIGGGANNWNLYASGGANNYMAGALGIGQTSLTGFNLRVSRNLTGATNATSISNGFVVQSDVTTSAYGYRSFITTQAAAFTLPDLFHYAVEGGTAGAGSTITNQSGFAVISAMTSATNNFGFVSSLANAANRWNFYAGGTAPNYMAGALGIGATTLTGYNVAITRQLTGATTQYSVGNQPQFMSDVTSQAVVYRSFPTTQAAAFTVPLLIHYTAENLTVGAGSTVTTQAGFYANANLTGATTNYGFYSDIASAANRWNLYASGTAKNYMAGSLGIGTTSSTSSLAVNKNLTGGTIISQVQASYTVQSDVTAFASSFDSFVQTQFTAFTLGSLAHYRASGLVLGGGGSAVTNQYGFYADNIFDATNNYGFYAAIDAGTNKWNFYASATANNAFRGNSRFGDLTAPVATVDVTGNIAATTSILSTGATSGVGYATGAGGAVTQLTSRTTGVTLNKVSGAITLVSAAGSAAYQTFTVTNSAVAATDVVIVNQKSGTDKYITMVTTVAAGSFQITFATTGGTTTEQPVFNFAVIKAVAA